MARHEKVSCPEGEWTELSDGENIAAALTFYAHGEVMIATTTSGTEPADLATAIKYEAGHGERNITLAELFPGISGVRLWAWGVVNGAAVFVSYA